MKLPPLYDGKPDLAVFDAWLFKLVNYMTYWDIDDEAMIRLMVDALEGKALEFYFQHIASKIHLWTITKIILIMFTNCFPSQFINQLRRKLSRITQGK